MGMVATKSPEATKVTPSTRNASATEVPSPTSRGKRAEASASSVNASEPSGPVP